MTGELTIMKRFKRQSDLIKHACKRAMQRNDNKKPPSPPKGDFLEQARRKLKGTG